MEKGAYGLNICLMRTFLSFVKLSSHLNIALCYKSNNFFGQSWLRYSVWVFLTFKPAAHHLNLRLSLRRHRPKLMFRALMLLEPQWRLAPQPNAVARLHPWNPFSPAGFIQTLHEASPRWNVNTRVQLCLLWLCLPPDERATLSRRGYDGKGNISTTMCLVSCSDITPWTNPFAGKIIRIVAGVSLCIGSTLTLSTEGYVKRS